MRACLFFLLFSMMTTMTQGTEIPFYLGTYPKGNSKGIYMTSLDSGTGKFSELKLAVEIQNASFLAYSPDRKFLYAASEDNDSTLASLRVNPDRGLTLLNQIKPGGEGTCFVTVDATGHNVLVANYFAGSIACYQTKADGSIGERTAYAKFADPVPGRKNNSNGHAVYVDPGNHFVYACDLGTDQVWAFSFDAGKGTLVPLSPASAGTPAGSGPRHLAIRPDGKFVYVINEHGMSVTVFSRDLASGALTEIQTISSLPKGTPLDKLSAAEIEFHPSGKWLYVSNRGHESITSFTMGSDGKLTWLQNIPVGVDHPRSFAIDPSGEWLVAAGMNSDKISSLKLDPATGKLSAPKEFLGISSPVCVLF